MRRIRARVEIVGIKGRRQRSSKATREPRWYGAHLVFLFFQVEDRRRGNEIVEDRYVMLRARSDKEAWGRARRYGEQEMSIGLNRYGRFSRVILEEVHELYEMFDTPSKAKVVEVFSRLRHRRVRENQIWSPRSRPAAYSQRSLGRAPRSSKR